MALNRLWKFGVLTAGVVAVLTITSMAWADGFQATCRYFSNQAFQDRHTATDTTFPMQLAQDCVDARIYARSNNPQVKIRAEAYLEQLDAYRTVVSGLLLEAERPRDPRILSDRLHPSASPSLAPVSSTGAYLIARHMGLIRTHRDWTMFRLALTSADARFRVD